MATGDKWTLSMGCHKGTLMSRDNSTEKCDSLEQCRQRVVEAERSWARIGYYVWYADATGPNGEKIKLHQGTPYR